MENSNKLSSAKLHTDSTITDVTDQRATAHKSWNGLAHMGKIISCGGECGKDACVDQQVQEDNNAIENMTQYVNDEFSKLGYPAVKTHKGFISICALITNCASLLTAVNAMSADERGGRLFCFRNKMRKNLKLNVQLNQKNCQLICEQRQRMTETLQADAAANADAISMVKRDTEKLIKKLDSNSYSQQLPVFSSTDSDTDNVEVQNSNRSISKYEGYASLQGFYYQWRNFKRVVAATHRENNCLKMQLEKKIEGEVNDSDGAFNYNNQSQREQQGSNRKLKQKQRNINQQNHHYNQRQRQQLRSSNVRAPALNAGKISQLEAELRRMRQELERSERLYSTRLAMVEKERDQLRERTKILPPVPRQQSVLGTQKKMQRQRKGDDESEEEIEEQRAHQILEETNIHKPYAEEQEDSLSSSSSRSNSSTSINSVRCSSAQNTKCGASSATAASVGTSGNNVEREASSDSMLVDLQHQLSDASVRERNLQQQLTAVTNLNKLRTGERKFNDVMSSAAQNQSCKESDQLPQNEDRRPRQTSLCAASYHTAAAGISNGQLDYADNQQMLHKQDDPNYHESQLLTNQQRRIKSSALTNQSRESSNQLLSIRDRLLGRLQQQQKQQHKET